MTPLERSSSRLTARSTSSQLSLEEKQLIYQWKLELNADRIPRKEWASIIQQRLVTWRKNQKKILRDQSKWGQHWKHTTKQIKKFLLKFMLKRQKAILGDLNDDAVEELMDMMAGMSPKELTEDPLQNLTMKLMGSSKIPMKSEISQNSTFLTKEQQITATKTEVFFNFEDEE